MSFDNIGRLLRTNHVDINPERLRKRYRQFSPTMLWGVLERKPYMSAKARYEREKRVVPLFYNAGLNTPNLIGTDDSTLTLDFQTFELTDLVEVFEDPRIHRDDKLQYLKEALELLRDIHNLGETHGDPYLKNFFRLNRRYPKRGSVYTCDFEYERKSSDSQATDVLILAADGAHLLSNNHQRETQSIFALVSEVHGRDIGFKFDLRDGFFYSARFGMRLDFFRYFS